MNARIAAFTLLFTGCIPIPVKKEFVVWPTRTIKVVDEKGTALADVKVRVVRIRYPHHHEDEVRTLTANKDGVVKTERETKTLKVFPLMMHGVPGFSFEACADAKGYAATSASWSNPDDPSVLTLKLTPGSRPCGVEIDYKPPPTGSVRIESIRREDDGKFLLVVALPPNDDPAGAELSKPGADPLKITKVDWQSPQGGAVRRAHVRVSGDPMQYAYGDIVARR
jgi:hypothetical protein